MRVMITVLDFGNDVIFALDGAANVSFDYNIGLNSISIAKLPFKVNILCAPRRAIRETPGTLIYVSLPRHDFSCVGVIRVCHRKLNITQSNGFCAQKTFREHLHL